MSQLLFRLSKLSHRNKDVFVCKSFSSLPYCLSSNLVRVCRGTQLSLSLVICIKDYKLGFRISQDECFGSDLLSFDLADTEERSFVFNQPLFDSLQRLG